MNKKVWYLNEDKMILVSKTPDGYTPRSTLIRSCGWADTKSDALKKAISNRVGAMNQSLSSIDRHVKAIEANKEAIAKIKELDIKQLKVEDRQ